MAEAKYRKQAEYLIESAVKLQRQILIKHTAIVLEAFHDELKAKDGEIQKAIDEALLIQALRIRNEAFKNAGMDQKMFTSTYIGEINDDIKALANREGIII